MTEDDFEVEAIQGERLRLSKDDLKELNVGGFTMRFTLLPVTVDKMVLHGGILPYSKEELQEKLGEMGIAMDSHLIPTIAMKMFVSRGKYHNGLPVSLLPAEDPQDKVGLGHYPLFESIGSGMPKFPEHEQVASQLSKMLRAVQAPNNVNSSRLSTMFQTGSFPTTTTGNIRHEWPEYSVGQDDSRRVSTGMSSFL